MIALRTPHAVVPQGKRGDEFIWTNDNELVGPPFFVCDTDKHAIREPDAGWRPCGCGRSWTGIESGKGSTIAVVTKEPLLTPERTRELVAAGTLREWGDDLIDWYAEACQRMWAIASEYEPGTLVTVRWQPDETFLVEMWQEVRS